MDLSHYLKIYAYQDAPQTQLLFSTRKGSKVLLKDEIIAAIEKGELSPGQKKTLSELEMIVPDVREEKREFINSIDSKNQENKGLHITVVMNLDCNFNCRYCFEGDIKGNLYLNNKNEELLIEFIKKKFTPDKKHLNIDFFGGEPFLSMDRMVSISENLKTFISSRSASYKFSVTTNGSLMNRKKIELLVSLGLSTVKVTLDGPPEIHNENRPFKNGAESFDVIIKNIKECHDLTKIQIGGNYDESNYKQFVFLIDHLEEVGLTPEKVMSVKFDPVMKPQNGNSISNYKKGCMSVNEPWLIEADVFLRKEILMRGYVTPPLLPGRCMVEIDDSFVINMDGTIYKCPTFLGKTSYLIGTLENGLVDYTSLYKRNMWRNEDCVECEYLPLCFGGCRYMAYLRDGMIKTVDCRKAYYDSALETLVKQDVMYRR